MEDSHQSSMSLVHKSGQVNTAQGMTNTTYDVP